ncbi:MAG: Glycine dehydrogenase [Evtepia sp.]|nr:Glycine dehydrogenase [Evtepia sp.]
MGHFLPSTLEQRDEMLKSLGLSSMEELYRGTPEALILKDGPNIPSGKSELEVLRSLSALAGKNKVFPSIFRGAGAYRHYIPAVVSAVISKETFLTAYTPYQPEISQGILQSIYEFQTMICELTGMDTANASVYDGASAAAEAVAMCRDRKRSRALVSGAANPQVMETVRTYCWASGHEMELIPVKNGVTDIDALGAMLTSDTACVYLEQPNYFGQLEEATQIGELTHEHGAKFIMGVNPIAAAILKTPAQCGADIAVGEGQPLGIPLSFGGPYLGFMAATEALMRKLPGRIAGETTDAKGNRAFVLTLQAREQHIRREKASSNICSNQALCATSAAVYIAAMGPDGLREVAEQCYHKAHYLAQQISKVPGFALRHHGVFFHEFVTECSFDVHTVMERLESQGILGGLPLKDGGILWCATEMNTKEEMDALVSLLQEVSAE